ncbi:hypothetical protein OUZ56_005143 [Daphnia magna]|uniref:Uncharacterized protein n=1 Tax=Daphnia magna TaxID=35525 RepID=A0ABQ9YRY5_9CRUS|nr:hypothetical protein OUZ56_005143 [Daphnia magna]
MAVCLCGAVGCGNRKLETRGVWTIALKLRRDQLARSKHHSVYCPAVICLPGKIAHLINSSNLHYD